MAYAEQLKSPHWQKRRLEILSRDEFSCQFCKEVNDTLHVHHKKYIKGNRVWEYEDCDLITLCEHCHDIVEYLKKEGIIVINCRLSLTRKREKAYITAIHDNETFSIWSFQVGGFLNGKELGVAMPMSEIHLIAGFIKSNSKNG